MTSSRPETGSPRGFGSKFAFFGVSPHPPPADSGFTAHFRLVLLLFRSPRAHFRSRPLRSPRGESRNRRISPQNRRILPQNRRISPQNPAGSSEGGRGSCPWAVNRRGSIDLPQNRRFHPKLRPRFSGFSRFSPFLPQRLLRARFGSISARFGSIYGDFRKFGSFQVHFAQFGLDLGQFWSNWVHFG